MVSAVYNRFYAVATITTRRQGTERLDFVSIVRKRNFHYNGMKCLWHGKPLITIAVVNQLLVG